MKGRNDNFLKYVLFYKPSLVTCMKTWHIVLCSSLAAHNLQCIQKQIVLAGIELSLKNVSQLHLDGYCNYSVLSC